MEIIETMQISMRIVNIKISRRICSFGMAQKQKMNKITSISSRVRQSFIYIARTEVEMIPVGNVFNYPLIIKLASLCLFQLMKL